VFLGLTEVRGEFILK